MTALILYASIGSGHRRAAEVLAHSFQEQLGWPCQTIDLLSLVSPYLPNLANNLSGWLLKIAASFYDQVWADDEALRAVDHLLAFTDLIGLMRDLADTHQPDLFVCTHALPARILSLLWARDGRALPTLNVVTDFMVNGLWPVDHITAFVVASAASQRRLVDRGFPEEYIHPLGIPVAPHFAARPDSQRRLRRRLGLADRPTLLAITGGGRAEPYEQIARIVRQLFHHWAGGPALDWQVVVLTGQNRANLASLRRLAADVPFDVTLRPWVAHVAEWMAASNLLLTKPGGLTAAEALSCGLPLLLVGSGPGQEMANAAVLAAAGCAVSGAGETDLLASQINALLGDAVRQEALRRACWSLARPQAAEEIACLAQTLATREMAHE